MAEYQEKIAYNDARRKALQDLARAHPEEYERLVEKYLKRPLQQRGRPISERIARGEKRRS